MKKAIRVFLVLAGLAAAVGGAVYLWGQRPWRVVVEVNGHVMTAGELRARGKGLLEDAKKSQHLVVPKNRAKQAEAQHYYEARAANLWVLKMLMLDEALARKLKVTPGEAQESLRLMEERLKDHGDGMTVEDYFKHGPLPEDMLRSEFEEGVLLTKLLRQEVEDKITLSPDEITKHHEDLQRVAMLTKKVSPAMIDRKYAIDSLRRIRYLEGTRKFYQSLRAKADVKAPEYPEVEAFTPSDGKPLEMDSSSLVRAMVAQAAKKQAGKAKQRQSAEKPAADSPAGSNKDTDKGETK